MLAVCCIRHSSDTASCGAAQMFDLYSRVHIGTKADIWVRALHTNSSPSWRGK